MKKRYAIIAAVVILIIAIIAIRKANSDIITVPAEVTTIENSISTKGFIVRDEKMYYATANGTVYYNAQEGERVPKDSQIATIFEGKVDSDALKELSVIDAKLKRAYEAESSSILHKSDTGSLENDIISRVGEVYGLAETDDISKIAELHSAIDSLRLKGEYNVETGVDRLEDEKWQALEKIDAGRKDIYTEISGVFSTYLDGLEQVLAPDRIEQYDPTYIKGLKNRESTEADNLSVSMGDPICKIMNNHVWYALAAVGPDIPEECKKDKSVKLRFKNMGNSEVDGTIEYISDADANGDRLVLIRCSTYVESVFSYRDADMDIIFNSYTGYKVPVHAIRTRGDKSYVVGRSNNTAFDCEVKIVYSDKNGETAIVESTDEAQNKLSKAKRIIVSDTNPGG